ncbi:BnaA07g03890D [Brassica napus]|uniref:Lipase n=1 Tax=Brassica napus TaxID=3708 RepID=A0A078IGD2_BRANA|nr:triacylglycerol lipase 1-like [Brassica napus]CAF2157850.1 unnamed protein product [Brassica napus]CDY48218.1 BnaA07g03890D [Brassica napus]
MKWLLVAVLTAFTISSAVTQSHILLGSPVNSLCADLIHPAGYSCTEHTIQTKDGYILALQRVASPAQNLTLQYGPPVLLQHGLFMAGDVWFLDSPKESLGFILADHGFDVWVGNVRGTRYSYGHVTFSETDKEFWDWSWQDLAMYDLAEMVQYMYSLANSKIFLVGHSQGTIMSFAALTQPRVAEMVEAAALLCPISYLDHVTAPLVERMVFMHLDQMVVALGLHQINFRSETLVKLVDSLCEGHMDCTDFLSSITGKNCCFNDSRIEYYLDYEPHPSSVKNLRHLFQMIRKGSFAQYDYGFLKNILTYGTSKPPEFKLSLIPASLPMWMGYGGSDLLADVKDVERTLAELPSRPELLYLENYGHIDFVLSTSAKEDVYKHMIQFFRARKKSSTW